MKKQGRKATFAKGDVVTDFTGGKLTGQLGTVMDITQYVPPHGNSKNNYLVMYGDMKLRRRSANQLASG